MIVLQVPNQVFGGFGEDWHRPGFLTYAREVDARHRVL